jgi:hypothetical protein
MTATAHPRILAHAARPPRGHAASMRSHAITATVFFLVALSWSPLLPALLRVPINVALLGSFVILAGLTAEDPGIDVRIAGLSVLLLCGSLIVLLATQSPLALLRTAPIPLLIFAAWQARAIQGLPERICSWLTVFLLVGVAGAWLGSAYALFGGEPLLSIINSDGRENGLYLTTMSNTNTFGLIRPSFIYDEPGAFSFVLCATVALREILGRARKPSYLLLFGGLITLSLTHFVIAAIYLVIRIGIVRTAVVATAIAAALSPFAADSDELAFFIGRFAIEDGRLVGDNRSDQIENFAAVVHPSMILFGDVECHRRPEQICEEHGDITSSPVTPTYRGGILALLVQLGVHAGLLIAMARTRRFRFGALALSLLLLQRPYFEIAGYGFLSYLLLFLMFGSHEPRAPRPSAAR